MTPFPAVISGREEPAGLPPPLQALSAFYAAFNGRDLAGLAANWAQTSEVVMANPVGGVKAGWPAIAAVYAAIFDGPARVYVEFYDYTFVHTAELAFFAGRERGAFRVGEASVDLAIRTSRIFQRIAGEWRQVHHHGSIDDPDLLARYQAAVRGQSVARLA